MSSAIERPGAALGFYPERPDSQDGWPDRIVHACRGLLAPRLDRSGPKLDAFVAAVHREQGVLRGLAGQRFDAAVAAARNRLARDGLCEEGLVRAFALAREAASRTLGVEHYDVQILAGRVLANGKLAEMETGEGKTLAATLPACAAALAGIPVHVLTANDYLVERDAATLRPLYAALGLTVGAVTEREREPGARRAAYACDITYGTGKTIAFDYLRDRLERGTARTGVSEAVEGLSRDRPLAERLLLRGLCFGIVDEADSLLIDEARTPLILAAAGGPGEREPVYRAALELALALAPDRDFRMRPQDAQVELTEAGCARLAEQACRRGGFWTGPRRREEWVLRALRALHLHVRDRDYLVREGRVEIIDQPTGRVAPDRSWEQGLHQLIEVKEGCPVTAEHRTRTRISFQRFFRRYLRLAGMTGTAREVARELWSVYALEVVRIPTRRPVIRRSLGVRAFASESQKWDAVVARLRELTRSGRPALVGTSSVAASERLGNRLAEAGLAHQVLNARQDAAEAEIVAAAGTAGRITVATNMAGRGTDIRLASGVPERGGLHVIATERGAARRIDRQLFGRCGRQGDPGSYELVTSLEDEGVRLGWSPIARRICAWLLARSGMRGADRLVLGLMWVFQRAEERRSARARRSLVSVGAELDRMLAFTGRPD